MDNSTLHLDIISPEAKIFSGDVSSAVFPGGDGFFGVLPHHTPMISSLNKGVITYKVQGEQYVVEIERGVVEVRNNEVTVCVEQIQRTES
ncbi:MAG: ATP synthase F1 subunit epsilon [Dysgonamonadaceae bacterium]